MRKICLLLFIVIFGFTSVSFAGEYKLVVIPNNLIDSSEAKSTIEKISIEDILTQKIINQLDLYDSIGVPTLDILRIAVLNNPYIAKTSDPIENAKMIADSYNVSNVVIVNSKLVLHNTSQQKEIWNKFNLPVLNQLEDCYQVVTTIIMYDMKTKEPVWNDVCFHKLSRASDGMSSIKFSTVNLYYDNLVHNFVKELKSFTSAPDAVTKSKSVKNTTKSVSRKNNNTEKKQNTNFVKTTIPAKTVQQNTVQTKTNTEPQQSFSSKMSDSFKNTKNKIHNYLEEKETERAVREIKQQEQKEIEQAIIKKEEAKKQVKSEQQSVSDKIKDRYNSVKQSYEAKKEESIKADEEAKYYTTISSPDIENGPQINNYIQMKPRNNSRNYMPKFDSSVNDI